MTFAFIAKASAGEPTESQHRAYLDAQNIKREDNSKLAQDNNDTSEVL